MTSRLRQDISRRRAASIAYASGHFVNNTNATDTDADSYTNTHDHLPLPNPHLYSPQLPELVHPRPAVSPHVSSIHLSASISSIPWEPPIHTPTSVLHSGRGGTGGDGDVTGLAAVSGGAPGTRSRAGSLRSATTARPVAWSSQNAGDLPEFRRRRSKMDDEDGSGGAQGGELGSKSPALGAELASVQASGLMANNMASSTRADISADTVVDVHQEGARRAKKSLWQQWRASRAWFGGARERNRGDAWYVEEEEGYGRRDSRSSANTMETGVEKVSGMGAMKKDSLWSMVMGSRSSSSGLEMLLDARGDGNSNESERYRHVDYSEVPMFAAQAKRKRKKFTRTIEIHVTSMENRQKFLIKLAKALMMFGAPSHRIESQLQEMARTLGFEASFIILPGATLMSFSDLQARNSETFCLRQNSSIALGMLHETRQVYRQVLRDEISAREGSVYLQELMEGPPLWKKWIQCGFAFWLSATICPLAFGGSFLDMWIAGAFSCMIRVLQLTVAAKNVTYANVFEISMTLVISFAARGLSSIRSQIFCYDAICFASIVTILPGFLILGSSLELTSKTVLCGSTKMVYAIVYTIFLGFALQVGSSAYLLIDPTARGNIQTLAHGMTGATKISGQFITNTTSTSNLVNTSTPIIGIWSFSNQSTILATRDIVEGCYRNPSLPWFTKPFPWWTQFFLVPSFAMTSSLSSMQPLNGKLVAQVLIASVAWTVNKVMGIIANGKIKPGVVAAVGAFTVGVLGSIYSRAKGGTPFAAMITGILFLVPSGLSQAGGLTAGSGIDIGGAMLGITMGITVGLYMSQTFLAMFGMKKSLWDF